MKHEGRSHASFSCECGHKGGAWSEPGSTEIKCPECQKVIMVDGEIDRILAECEEREKERETSMPTVEAAIEQFHQSFTRLKELGFEEIIYAPKDGSTFDAIEPGSTGIHECFYSGKWPDGSFWAWADGDQCPSHAVLFREKAEKKQDGVYELECGKCDWVGSTQETHVKGSWWECPKCGDTAAPPNEVLEDE